MVFSSLEFIFQFLPVFLMIYYLIPGGWKNLWLLAGSLGFYFGSLSIVGVGFVKIPPQFYDKGTFHVWF